ncbi:MAG: RsmB/NOP family class I SAM-dependent RNA methyltransferase [Alphaproteobacteria bacterium]
MKDRSNAAGWAERLGARLLPTGSLRLPPGAHDVTALPGYADGAWWVQDAAAALPGQILLAALPDGGRGLTAIDLCAAPGGKSAQLAAAGAAVIAVDRSAARLRILDANARRLGLVMRAVAADARNWRPDRAAAAVLLDAPCSATGTIRRHPDVPWLKRRETVRSLLPVQAELFSAASAMVEPGGVMVYSVCSLEPEEGIAQADRFLACHPGWQRVPIQPDEIGGLAELVTPDGDLRTLPCHMAEAGGMDGFFAVRLRAPG